MCELWILQDFFIMFHIFFIKPVVPRRQKRIFDF